MKYRIYGYFKDKEGRDVRYFVQRGRTALPNRTLLSTDFFWVSVLASPTEFEDFKTAMEWFRKLALWNENYASLTLERI